MSYLDCLLDNPEFVKKMKELLPHEEHDDIGTLFSCLRTGQLAPLIREFNLGDDAVAAAAEKKEWVAFVTALQNGPHRPCSTTESGRRRHVTIDYGSSTNQKIDEESSIIKNKEHIKKMPTIIKYSGQGKEVYLCGTFNGWQKLKMSRTQKDFVAMIELGEGDHEYKFLVDGSWVTDPNTAIIENNSGFKNNLIHVQKGDFDAFEALDMDSATVSKAQGLKAAKLKSVQPQSVFGQEMPHFNTEIGPQVVSSRKDLSGPPILPPHLLQVILNKVGTPI